MGRVAAIILPDSVEVVRHSTLIAALDNGESIERIAESVGVTPQTIHYHLRRMGYVYSRTQGWRRNGSA